MVSLQELYTLLVSRCYRVNRVVFRIVPILALLSFAGPALSAQTGFFNPVQTTLGNGDFTLPRGAVAAGNGDIYVADTFHNAIKRIVAVNGMIPASPAVITLATGFNRPMGVAVDPSGNVYEADSGTGTVQMLMAVNGVVPISPVINLLASGFSFSSPSGVALDASRNVYVADSGNHAVYQILAAGGYTTVNTLSSAFTTPTGVAVDSSGNVYVADQGSNTVVELTAASSYATAVPLGSGFNAPFGVAVDGSGDVYVADEGNDSVKEMLAVGGAVPASPTLLTLASVIPSPYGVAVDGHGNVLIAPADQYVIQLATTTANFGQVSVGIAAPPQQILTFTFTAAGTIDAPKVFTLGVTNQDFADTGTGTCTTNGTSHPYGIGDTCTVAISFNPAYPGPRSGEVQITSGSTILGSFNLAGTGTGPQLIFNPYNLIDIGNNSYGPGNMVLDTSGNIFLADNGNNAVEELTAASGYTTTLQLAPATINSTNSNLPSDVALDGAGNLYVSDRATESIYELTVASGYNTVITLATNVGQPYGLALDSAGNIFVASNNPSADGAVFEILAVNGSIPANPAIVPLGGTYAFSFASGVALDSLGNLFISDQGHSAIVELTAASNYTTATLIDSGFSFASEGLAFDAQNNLYVADTYNQQVEELFASNGYTTMNVLIAGLSGYPSGIAVDQRSNVFVGQADGGIPLFEFDYADPPSLNFAATNVGSTSSDSPQTVTYTNNGNATLNFSAPVPYIAQLSFYIDASSTCPVALPISLAPGASCTEAVDFSPTVGGPLLGQLITTDNNLNISNSSQIVPLSGTGVGNANAITIIPATLPGGTVGAPYSQTVSATGGLSPYTFSVVSGSIPTGLTFVGGLVSGTPTATGTFNFTVQGIDHNGTNATQAYSVTIAVPAQTITFPQPSAAVDYTSTTLTATASSALPVTYTVVSGPGYVNGSTIYYTGVGTVVVEADQAGDITHLPAPPVQRSITVTEFSEPVASTSGTLSALVTFTTAGTLQNIQAHMQGVAGLDFNTISTGTCTTSTHYAIGDTCIATFNFKPAYPGQRYGALMLSDSSGNILATSYIYALGIGPQINFYPGTQSNLIYSLFDVGGFKVDPSGNIYYTTGFDHNVFKETPTGGGNYTQSLVAGGSAFYPGDIAIDGAGNLFITDVYAHRVVKETPSGSGYTQSTVLTGFSQPSSIAVDGVGNLYVSDAVDQNVYKETLAPSGSYTQSTVLSGLNGGAFVAVDGSGNLYILDSLQTSVLKETLTGTGYSQSTIGSGLFLPRGMAVDAVGNVYISNSGQLLMETPSGGIYIETGIADLVTDALAAGSGGDVYAIDETSYSLMKLDYTNPPTLTYGLQTDGTASAPQSVLLQNNGNAAFTSVSPGLSVAANFTQVAGSGTPADCAVPFSMAAGASCNLSIEFTPVSPASGSVNGSVTLTDNNLNASPSGMQVIPLNGTAGTSGPTVTNVNPNNGTTGGSTPVTITGTNFTGTTTVNFGSVAVSGFVVVNSTTITTNTPAGSPGTVDVTVTTPGGTSAINPSDQYTYTQYFSATNSTLTASPTTTAAGTSSIVTATLLDENNLPIVGATINFQTTGSATLSSITVTNASGVATASLTDTVAETVTLSATSAAPYAGGFVQTPKVTFTAGAPSNTTSTVIANPTTQTAGSNSTVTVSLRDQYSNLISGTTVSVSGNNSSSVTNTSPTTNSSGVATFTVTDKVAELDAFSATASSVALGSATVNYTAGAAASVAIVGGSSQSTTVNTAFPAPLVVVVQDAYGNLVPNATVTAQAPVSTNPSATFSSIPVTGNNGQTSFTATANSLYGGPYNVTASAAGAATSATFALTNLAAAQTINFTQPTTPVIYGAGTITLVASASSALPVTYSIVAGNTASATLAGNQLTLSSTGSITIAADQAGNGTYAAAPEVTRTILVNPATPVLAFTTIPAHTYGDAPFPVVATSASNGTVTYGVSSGAATVVAATGVVTLSGAGSITFTAAQAATQNYTTANTQTTINVGKQASKTTLGASSVSITPIQSVTLTATVASTIVGSPTQQVTFYDGSTQLGSAVTLGGGQAQLIVPSLLSGSHTITATYSGDTNFLASNSNSVVIQVAPLDFTFTATGTTNQTVIPGVAANFTFALAPLYNIYPGPVTFTATGGPTGATYTFTPTTVTANGGAQSIGLSVQPLPESARNSVPARPGPYAPIAFALLLPLLGLRKARRKLGRGVSLLLLLAVSAFAVSSLAGCSQGVGFFGQPVQTYTITVTASSGSVQHSATVNLQVQ